nr:MAG TPA: hypothetical protein [Caudoviricetes sp.]
MRPSFFPYQSGFIRGRFVMNLIQPRNNPC